MKDKDISRMIDHQYCDCQILKLQEKVLGLMEDLNQKELAIMDLNSKLEDKTNEINKINHNYFNEAVQLMHMFRATNLN